MNKKIKINEKRNNEKQGFTKYDPMTFTDKIRFALTPKSEIMIATFHLSTGDYESFPVKVKNQSFELFKKKYLVDNDFMYFNRTFGMYESFYHEQLSIPVQKSIPVNEIKTKLKNNLDATYSRVVNNVEPEILKTWNASKVIQDSIKGQKLGNDMKQMTIMLWIIGTISLVSMLILVNLSGIFS